MDAALLGLVTLLLGAAIVGQGGRDEKHPFLPLGDRIAAGMLAVPLVALMIRHVTNTDLSALAPVPLAAYLTMLAVEDGRSEGKEGVANKSRLPWVTCIAGLLTYAGLLALLFA